MSMNVYEKICEKMESGKKNCKITENKWNFMNIIIGHGRESSVDRYKQFIVYIRSQIKLLNENF